MKYLRMLLSVLVCLVLAGCITAGPNERVHTPPEKTPFDKSLTAMGVALRAGNIAEAEKQAKAAMMLSRPADLGNEFYGIPFIDLASLYLQHRKYTEAEALYRQAIAFLGTLGPFDERARDAVFSISQLGERFLSQGRSIEAGEIFRRLLAYKERVLGPVHIQLTFSLNQLGWLHERDGRYGEAEKFYKRALAMQEELVGVEHPDLIYTLYWLTRLSRKQGRTVEADRFQTRALTIQKKTDRLNPFVGHGLPAAARITKSAYLWRRRGRYIQSEFQFIRALRIREKLLGNENPVVILSHSDLASIYKVQGLYDRSERLYLQAGKVAERALGPDHPVLALLLDNRAVLYLTQNRYAEAEPLIKRSLAIFEKARGPVHADVATSLNNLASLYRMQEKYAEAEAAAKRSLAIYEQLDHPNVGVGLGNLALIYYTQGKHGAAEQAFKRALVKLEDPQAYQSTLAVNRHNLARLYIDLGRYAEAEPLLERALTMLESTLNPTHPFVIQSLTQYVRLLRATGRGAEAQKIDARRKANEAQNKR